MNNNENRDLARIFELLQLDKTRLLLGPESNGTPNNLNRLKKQDGGGDMGTVAGQQIMLIIDKVRSLCGLL